LTYENVRRLSVRPAIKYSQRDFTNGAGDSGVFGGRPAGLKVDKISETDAIRACYSGELTAREERRALAIVHSLTTNPYCS